MTRAPVVAAGTATGVRACERHSDAEDDARKQTRYELPPAELPHAALLPPRSATTSSGAGAADRRNDDPGVYALAGAPAYCGRGGLQLETRRYPAGLLADLPMLHTAATTRAPNRGAEAESRSRLVDLSARSEKGDYEERHHSDQNVDNAAHHDPAKSSHRHPFRR